MRKSITVRALAVTATLALAGGLLSGPSVAQTRAEPEPATKRQADAQGPGAIVEHDLNAGNMNARQSVDNYWTAERMANAKPARQQFSAGDLRASARMAEAERVAPGIGSNPVAGEPEVMKQAARKSYSRRVGKMFYKFKKQNWVCSGAVVNSKKKNMVMTAAHCLWDKKKKWAHKILFIPGYTKKGKSPHGRWYAEKVAIPKRWKRWGKNRELPQADYGIMLVENKRRKGKNIARKVGAYGLQWGVRKWRRKYKATGYPAFGRHSGRQQKSCRSRSRLWKKYSSPRSGYGLLKMKCRAVTAGSSGGPWIRKGRINGQNALVNSFKKPRWVATPWLAGGMKKLYRKYRKSDPKGR